jgi:hypothetical protein
VKLTIEFIITNGNSRERQDAFKITYDSLIRDLARIEAIKADCENVDSPTCAKSQAEKNQLLTDIITMRYSLNRLIQTGNITSNYNNTLINPPLSLGGSKRKTTKGRRKQNKSRRNRKSRR